MSRSRESAPAGRVTLAVDVDDATLAKQLTFAGQKLGIAVVLDRNAPRLRVDPAGTLAHALRVELLRRMRPRLTIDDHAHGAMSGRARAWLTPLVDGEGEGEDEAVAARLSENDDGTIILHVTEHAGVDLGEPPDVDACVREARAIEAVGAASAVAIPDGAEERARAIVFGPTRTLSDPSSRRLLEAFGLQATPWKLAENAARAAIAAKAIGFPVDLRIASPDLSALDRIGLGVTGLRMPAEVRDAFRAIVREAKRTMPKARLLGLTVGRHVGTTPQLRLVLEGGGDRAQLRVELDDPIGRHLARPIVGGAPRDVAEAAGLLARFAGRRVLPDAETRRGRSLLEWITRLSTIARVLPEAIVRAEVTIAPSEPGDGWLVTAARVAVAGVEFADENAVPGDKAEAPATGS